MRGCAPRKARSVVSASNLLDGTLAATGPSSRGPAIVCGSNEETRLLLHGLLRLHRHPVAHEAARLSELDPLPPTASPTLLVFDAETENGDWADDLAQVLRRHPELRAVVVLPRNPGQAEEKARAAGARATLRRPFAIREFVSALERVQEGGTPPPPPADSAKADSAR